MTSSACRCWRNKIKNQKSRSSGRPWTLLLPARVQEKKRYLCRDLKCYMYKSCVHRPRTAQDSLPVLKGRQIATRHKRHQCSVSLCIKTRVTGAIATAITASPSSVLSETSLLQLHRWGFKCTESLTWVVCNNLLIMFLNHSLAVWIYDVSYILNSCISFYYLGIALVLQLYSVIHLEQPEAAITFDPLRDLSRQ